MSTQDWINVASLVIGGAGLLIGGAGLVLSIIVSRRQERDRLLDARRTVYDNLWIACDNLKSEVEAQVTFRRHQTPGQKGMPRVGPSDAARSAMKAVELIAHADAVLPSAQRLYRATKELRATFAIEPDDPYPPALKPVEWYDAATDWNQAAIAFREVVAKDLELPK